MHESRAQRSPTWRARRVAEEVLLDFFFFFQAEDGIRDVAVTGVQTCALPISSMTVPLDWANGVCPPSGQVKTSVPLSVVNTTMVLLSTPMSLSFFITMPMSSSSCAMPASWMVQLFSELRIAWYFGDRCVTMCMRVGLSHRKNGLPSALVLSRNLSARSRISSSTVSMRFGHSSPLSSIFCLPTLPQRGSTVESSTFVAHEWSMLRGPSFDLRFCG